MDRKATVGISREMEDTRKTDWKMNGKGKEGEGTITWKRKRDESEDINSTAKKGSHICMQLPVQLYISSWQSCSHHFLSFLPPPARLFPLLRISLEPLARANGDGEWGSAWMNGLFLSKPLLIPLSGRLVNQWSPLHETRLKCLLLGTVWLEWSPLALPPLCSLPLFCPPTSALSLNHHSKKRCIKMSVSCSSSPGAHQNLTTINCHD